MANSNAVSTPRRRNYVLVFIALTSTALLAALIWGRESRFEVGEAMVLPSLPKGYELEDLWFKSDGQLILVMRRPDEGAISLVRWRREENPDNITVQQIDLLGRVPQTGPVSQVRYSSGIRSEQRAGHAIVPYAVSQEGTTVAAVFGGALFVGSPAEWVEGKTASVSLRALESAEAPASSAEALVFSADNLVTLIHADGSVDNWDYVRGAQGKWFTRLPAAPLIWSRGSRLLIASPKTGDFGLLAIQGADVVKAGFGQFSSQDITAAAVSSDGSRIVYGTIDGTVQLYTVSPGEYAPKFSTLEGRTPLPVARPVRAVSPLDGGGVLIAGDFRDIFLLDAEKNLKSIAETQDGIRLMATRKGDLVYATPRNVVSAKVENRLVFDWFILSWIATVYAIALAILALFYDLLLW